MTGGGGAQRLDDRSLYRRNVATIAATVGLTGHDLAVLDVLTFGYSDGKLGRCWPSQARLADDVGASVPTVKRALRRLRLAGVLGVYVSLPKRTPDGTYTRRTNRYWFPTRRVAAIAARIRRGLLERVTRKRVKVQVAPRDHERSHYPLGIETGGDARRTVPRGRDGPRSAPTGRGHYDRPMYEHPGCELCDQTGMVEDSEGRWGRCPGIRG